MCIQLILPIHGIIFKFNENKSYFFYMNYILLLFIIFHDFKGFFLHKLESVEEKYELMTKLKLIGVFSP